MWIEKKIKTNIKDRFLELANYWKNTNKIIFLRQKVSKSFLREFLKFLINFARHYKCNQVLERVDKMQRRPFHVKAENLS